MKLSSSEDGIKRLSWKAKKFWAEKEVSVWHNRQSGVRLGAHKAQDVAKRKLLRKSRKVQVLRMALEGLLMWMLKPQTQWQRVNKHHHPECHQGVPGVWQVTVKGWRVRMQLERRERVVDCDIWVPNQASALASCGSWARSLKLSKPPFLYQWNGNINIM